MSKPQDQHAELFAPLPLSGKTAPNRFVFAAHQTNFATHNRFTERHVAYYETRAAGGAGTILLEGSVVHPSDWPYEYAIFGYEATVVDGYRQIADALHRHGVLALAHLTHSGMQGSSHYSQLPLWAPSPVPEVNSRELPQAMDTDDIAAIIEGFQQAARYARDGGLDGVELNAGQDSLIRQFLSPLTNQRNDDYGGSLDNRLRFARQIIQKVRDELSRRLVVGLRLSGDEHAPWAGIKPEDAVEIARLLAGDGLLDFISVTSGGIYTSHLTRPGLYQPPGFAVHLAAGIKTAVALPVFAQGSIVDPEMAATLLAQGQADAVEMTRALIADPELPVKLHRGQADAIRPCLLANQDNIIGLVQNPRLSCANNPSAGYEREAEFAPLKPTRIPHRILIVGGGPAGLEATRVAASRGHRVTLYEREPQLGGAIRLAAAAPGRERLVLAVDWLERQVRKLEVEIQTGVNMTAERIAQETPDAVIVAVGGIPGHHASVHFHPNAPVVNPRQVMRGEVPTTPGRAVVLDTLGDPIGMAVAEWLIERSWRVDIVTSDMFVGQRLTASLELTAWNQRAAARGVTLRPQFDALEVTEHSVIGADHFDHREIRLDAIDLVVDVSPEQPDETLYFALKKSGWRVFRAGDCVAPRYLSQAILEGYRAGREV
ncbi:MAG: NAD(P)-binding protein [Gammaproteobacteria bacterium]|nr:NAD(P)-binding protein [Gammaproteobacteria bacterium]